MDWKGWTQCRLLYLSPYLELMRAARKLDDVIHQPRVSSIRR